MTKYKEVFNLLFIYEKRSKEWLPFEMPKNAEESKRKRKLCMAALKVFSKIAETAKEIEGKRQGQKVYDAINNTLSIYLPRGIEGKFSSHRGLFSIEIFDSEVPEDKLRMFAEYIPCDKKVWIFLQNEKTLKFHFCAENFIRYFRKKVIRDYLQWLNKDAERCGFDENLPESAQVPPKEILENLRKRYYRGVRLEVFKMDNPEAPPVGTFGTVKTVDNMGNVIVDWDDGNTLSVVPEKDIVKICYG